MSIFVFAENSGGVFKKSALEAVSYASEVAAGNSCTAISIGQVAEDQLNALSNAGATQVIVYEDSILSQFNAELYAKLIAGTVQANNGNILVFSNTYSGKSLAPRTAALLKASIASGVISYPETTEGFKVKRAVYSGKAFAMVNLPGATKVLAITPNSFNLKNTGATLNKVNGTVGIDSTDAKTKSIEVSKASGKIALTEAELVVSGGRGMKGPENWHLIENLADTLGAATACSKPVSDIHWRPHSEHVGQTGITIKPNLYIAIGISGAIQHLAGVSSSKVIVAINKDPEAPFFKAADYGIVGDAFEVLPVITEAAKALKAK